MDLPPILLEGDEPSTTPASLPVTARAETGGQPAWTKASPPDVDSLPEAYGTGKLYLLARDPDCIYAHWDLSLEQQHQYNALSNDRHLVLRVFVQRKEGAPFREIHLHPDSQSWFVYVDRVGSVYVAELGYYARGGEWISIADSEPVATPPDAASPEQQVQFATVQPAEFHRPFEPSAASPVALLVPDSPSPSRVESPAPAPETPFVIQVQPASATDSAKPKQPSAPPPALTFTLEKEAESPAGPCGGGEWTVVRERALEEIVTTTRVSDLTSSLENVRRVEKVLEQELASMAAAQRGQLQAGVVPISVSSLAMEQPQAISSELGQAPGAGPEFWLMVNAELVIYGATDPTAEVTIGERRIRLRPDGSFSYRFALPDGNYELPITAVSVDDDRRHVALSFSRNTVSRGEVGKHPQDPALRPPAVENLS